MPAACRACASPLIRRSYAAPTADLRTGGLGHQAQSDHLPGLAACQFAQLVAVADTDETVAAETAGRLGVPGFTDAVTLLEAVAPDFVIVAVPHHAAPGVVEAAAKRGVHVLMEKPFATDIATAHHLAEVADKAGIEVMVSVQRRWVG
jgi:predicted dehydrogenase